jgi:regulator of replication initiation timing
MSDVDKLLEHAERIEEFAAAARAGMEELQPAFEAVVLENERLQRENDRMREAAARARRTLCMASHAYAWEQHHRWVGEALEELNDALR